MKASSPTKIKPFVKNLVYEKEKEILD